MYLTEVENYVLKELKKRTPYAGIKKRGQAKFIRG